MTNVYTVADIQKMQELEQQERIAGAGAEPQYLVANEVEIAQVETSDKAEISGTPLNSTQANAAINSSVAKSIEEEQYMTNDAKYREAIEAPFANQASSANSLIFNNKVRFDLKTIKGKETNAVVADYQTQVDDLADNQETEELLDQILAAYAEAHGKSIADLTEEEIIEAINDYINEHVNYESEEQNELGDLEAMIGTLLGGGEVSGDCEEIAILKAALLKSAGLGAELGFTVNDGVVDHVVVIVNGEIILNNNGADEVELSDVALKTTHNKDGEVVVVDSEGNVNTADYVVNTQSGDEAGAAGFGEGVATASNIDAAVTNDVMSFDDEAYLDDPDHDGYCEPDAEKLEKWAVSVLARANVLMSLLIALSSQFEARRVADEAFTGIPLDPAGKNNYKESFARKIRFLQKVVQMAIINVFKLANLRNQKTYNERMSKLKDKSDSGWFKFKNFWSGGKNGKKLQKKSLQESEKYLRSSEKTMEAMQQVLSTISDFLKSTAGDGEGAIFNLGMSKVLKNFSEKISEIKAEIEPELQKIQAKLEEIRKEEEKKWYEKFGEGFCDFFAGLGTFDWDRMWGGLRGILDGFVNFFYEVLPGDLGNFFGNFFEVLTAPGQWVVTLCQNPIQVVCEIIGLIADGIEWIAEQCGYDSGSEDSWGKQFTDGVYGFLADVKEAFDKIGAGGKWLIVLGGAVLGGLPGIIAAAVLNFTIGSFPDKEDAWAEEIKYVEDLDMEAIVEDYRGQLVGIQNAYRSYLSVKMMQGDMRNVARNKFTGLTGIANNAELLMLSAEGTLSNVSSIVDTTATSLMLTVRLHNSTVKAAKDLQLMERAEIMGTLGVTAAVVAVVLSIVATCLTCGGAGASVPAAVFIGIAIASATSGVAIAAQQNILSQLKGYDPLAPEEVEADKSGWSHGSVVLDQLDQIEHAEKANRRAAAYKNGAIITTSDDYYALDSQAFAAYEMKQNILNNAIRCIFSLLQNKQDLQRIADAEFTGSAAQDSGAALLKNAVENLMMQKQMVLSAIKFQQQEVVNAQNILKQNEMKRKQAATSFLFSMAGSALGALGGAFVGPVGAIIGMGIGSALGAAAAGLYNALTDKSLDMTFDGSNRELDELIERQGGNNVEGKLDRAEARAYQDMMNSGLVSIGDGYMGVDFGLVTKLYARIGAIYNAKEALAKARALRSELRNIVKQQFTGIATGSTGELTLSVNRANFSTAMKTMSNLVSFLQTKAQVMNRANQASKALNLSIALFAVNCALAGFAFIAGGLTSAGTALASIVQMTPSLMSFANAMGSLITSIMSFTSGKGHYENYEAKTTVDQTGKRVDNGNSVDSRLEQEEYEILTAMNEDVFQTLDGGFSAVSPMAAKLTTRMRQLYNVKEALSIARSISSEARKAAGAKIGHLDYGRDNVRQYESAAMGMLDSLQNALESIIQRRNQIEQAKQGIIFSSINVAISAASIVCAGVAAMDAGKATAANKAIKAVNSDKAVALKEFGIKDSAPKQQKLAQLAEARTKAESNQKFWGIISSIIAFSNTLATLTTQGIYDRHHNEHPENGSHVKNNAVNKKGGKEESAKAKGSNNVFSSLDSVDAEVASLENSLMQYQLNSQASVYIAARNEKIVQSILPALQGICNLISQIGAKDQTVYIQQDELVMANLAKNNSARAVAKVIAGMEKPEDIAAALKQINTIENHDKAVQIMEKLDKMLPEAMKKNATIMAAISSAEAALLNRQVAAAPSQDFKAEEGNFASTRSQHEAHMQRAEQISQQINESIKQMEEVQAKANQAAAEAQAASEDVNNVIIDNKDVMQAAEHVDLKEMLEQLEAQLAQAKLKHQQCKTKLEGLKQQLSTLKEQTKPAIQNAQQEIRDIEKQAKGIQKKIAQVEANKNLTKEQKAALLSDLRSQLSQLQGKREAIQKACKLWHTQVKAVEQHIVQVKEEFKGLTSQIAGLKKQIGKVKTEIAKQKGDQKKVSSAAAKKGNETAPAQEFVRDLQKGQQRAAVENSNRTAPREDRVRVDQAKKQQLEEPAVIATVSGSQIAPTVPSQAAPAKLNESQTPTSRMGDQYLHMKADQLEKAIQAKTEQLHKLSNQLIGDDAKVQDIKEEIAALVKSLEKFKAGKLEKLTPEVVQQVLEDLRNKLMEAGRKIVACKRVVADLKAAQQGAQAMVKATEIKIQQLKQEIAEVAQEIKGLEELEKQGKLEQKDQVRLEELKAKLQKLDTSRSNLTVERTMLKLKVKDISAQIKKVEAQMGGLDKEMGGLRQQIKEVAQLKVRLEMEQQQTALKGDNGSQQSFVAEFINGLLGKGKKRRQEDLENTKGDDNTPSVDREHQEALAGLKGSGYKLRKKERIQDRVNQAVRDEALYLEKGVMVR